MNTPVVLIFFNRPKVLKSLVDRIAEIQPNKLYLICDGPRFDRPDEMDKVQSCRNLFENLPWSCDINKNYAETNLGCRDRVVSGLNWVFEHEEEAIILEDDCIPIPDFFPFCEQMLGLYRETPRVMSIGGFNFRPQLCDQQTSITLTSHPMIWGWATWRRAWSKNETSVENEASHKMVRLIKARLDTWRAAFYWTIVLRKVSSSWGYLWMYSHWKNQAYQVLPTQSLVSNIGLQTPDSTHTATHYYQVPELATSFPTPDSIPEPLEKNSQLDRYIEDHIYSRSFRQRIRWFVLKYIKTTSHDR